MAFDIFSNTGLLILGFLVIGIYLLFEIKKFKHKIILFFLIAFIIFLYIGAVTVFKNKSVDFGSVEGVKESANLYFSWIIYVGKNLEQITANVIKMDWTPYNNSNLNKSKKKV